MTSPAERAIVVPLSRRSPQERPAVHEGMNIPIGPVLSAPPHGQEAHEQVAPDVVRVDCQGCTARPLACGDCVVTYLLGSPPEGVELAADEQDALEALAASGLVPSLQYSPREAPSRPSEAGSSAVSNLRSIGARGTGLTVDPGV